MSDNVPVSAGGRQCDLCDQQRFELIGERDRRGRDLRTVICRVCGLVSHERIPGTSELSAYYRRQYRQDYHGEYTPAAYRVVREWRRASKLVSLLSPHLSADDRIIEIGSGIGCTLKQLERAGYDAVGIEPGGGFRNFSVEMLRARVDGCELAQLPRVPQFNVVLLVHVLEHLPSPTASLAHVRTLLHKGGRLYLEVPNAGAPHAAPGKMFHFAHIHNFSRDTVHMLADKVGFRVDCWLSSPRDKNLCVLLRRSGQVAWKINTASYARMRRAAVGQTRLGYYVRWRYLLDRLSTLVGHATDRVLAQRRMQHIVASCRHHHVGLPAPRLLWGVSERPDRRAA